MMSRCCVTECVNKRDPGFRTCSLAAHRGEEKYRKERARKRKVAKVAGMEHEGSASGKGRKRDVKGVFCRKWTHNEQLMVRPCGIVVGRATFYSSESVTGVKVGHDNFTRVRSV